MENKNKIVILAKARWCLVDDILFASSLLQFVVWSFTVSWCGPTFSSFCFVGVWSGPASVDWTGGCSSLAHVYYWVKIKSCFGVACGWAALCT